MEPEAGEVVIVVDVGTVVAGKAVAPVREEITENAATTATVAMEASPAMPTVLSVGATRMTGQFVLRMVRDVHTRVVVAEVMAAAVVVVDLVKEMSIVLGASSIVRAEAPEGELHQLPGLGCADVTIVWFWAGPMQGLCL